MRGLFCVNGTEKSLREHHAHKGFYLGPSFESPIMGEEKPDEELMGKRKSSPRLSTTFDDVDNLRIARLSRFIHGF